MILNLNSESNSSLNPVMDVEQGAEVLVINIKCNFFDVKFIEFRQIEE